MTSNFPESGGAESWASAGVLAVIVAVVPTLDIIIYEVVGEDISLATLIS